MLLNENTKSGSHQNGPVLRIWIIFGSWIRIRIKVESWIRIRIKVKGKSLRESFWSIGALEGPNLGKSEW
jgi:hypothetical protein